MRELDLIVLLKDLPEEGLKRGAVGTIVFVPRSEEGYEVEFTDDSGDTIGVVSLTPSQVRPAQESEIRRRRVPAG